MVNTLHTIYAGHFPFFFGLKNVPLTLSCGHHDDQISEAAVTEIYGNVPIYYRKPFFAP